MAKTVNSKDAETDTQKKPVLNYVKKISRATVIGGADIVKKLTEKTTEPVELMQVFGVIVALRSGKGSYGDYVGFRGDFVAIRTSDAQQFRASECFLPPVAADP